MILIKHLFPPILCIFVPIYYKTIFYYIKLTVIFSFLIISFLIGISIGFILRIKKSSTYQTPICDFLKNMYLNDATIKLSIDRLLKNNYAKKKHIVISRRIDEILDDIFDLIIHNFVLTWYSELADNADKFAKIIHYNFWLVCEKFYRRLEKFDSVTFLTQDFVNAIIVHFHDARIANKKSKDYNENTVFVLHELLEDGKKEEEILRNLSHVILYQLLPDDLYELKPVVLLLREILINFVLKSTIETICDPYMINTRLLFWLKQREHVQYQHKRYFSYAATYEEFYNIIDKCDDLEQLKYLRFKIMTEIMDVTAVANIKKEHDHSGMYNELDNDKRNSKSKGDLLKGRNLSRYRNQLGVAKSQCERKIASLGEIDYVKPERTFTKGEQVNVLSFNTIMTKSSCRQYFAKYLQYDANNRGGNLLIDFWSAIENMKLSPKSSWHVLATDIYTQFLTSNTSVIRMFIDKWCMKRIQEFLKGNETADAFFQLQEEIYKYLHNKYYLSFIVSDDYHAYMDSLKGCDTIFERSIKVSTTEELIESIRINDHSNETQKRLRDLDEKINNKVLALNALSGIQYSSDNKKKKLTDALQIEIDGLKEERKNLEIQYDQMNLWVDYFDMCQVNVYSIEVIYQKDLIDLKIYIAVNIKIENNTRGWVIDRSLDDFKAYYEQIKINYPNCRLIKEIKSKNLFQLPKLKFKSKCDCFDMKVIDCKKMELNNFLNRITQDKQLGVSEISLAFFSHMPELLRLENNNISDNLKRSKSQFTLSGLFKSFELKRTEFGSEFNDSVDTFLNDINGDDDDDCDYDTNKQNDFSKDWIAQPLYNFIAELFELSGVFKWLRRTMISFVRVTFGRSINRQLRDTIKWLFDDDMIVFYLNSLRENIWPGGEYFNNNPGLGNGNNNETTETYRQQMNFNNNKDVNDDTKLNVRNKVKRKLLRNIPDALKSLVGEETAKMGFVKGFEIVQDITINKHLFYVLLELFLRKLFPEVFKNDITPRNMPVPATNFQVN